MHNAEKRKTVWALFEKGVAKKEIARLLEMDPKTVRGIIKDRGEVVSGPRSNRVVIDEERLKALVSECDGWMERVYEKLTEEDGLRLGYSTLTRRCRELGLSDGGKVPRCADGELMVRPGREMQHDTSPYKVALGETERSVIASGLYYRYSKVRYVKFYLWFDRFQMKCFFHEALLHFGWSCHECWIDNTNLAVWKGTGKNAVMVPEMTAFGRAYGFEWHAHELGHSNRKAGKERNFWTLETNFFPGRTFRDLEDLNRQAKEWATERYFRRPHAKTKIIPAEAFEVEKPSLVRIPETVIPPYREHERPTDRKGYVALRANFYWVPGTVAHEKMTLIETPSRLKIYRRHECVADYPLAPADKRGEKRRPEGMPLIPERPQNDRIGSDDEENRLRGIGHAVEEYLDWLKKTPGRVRYRHRFIRDLYAQSKTMTPSLFEKVIDQARLHGIAEIDAIERIARVIVNVQDSDSPWKEEPILDEYLNRESYHEGRFSDEPTLTMYARLFERGKQEEGK